MIINLLTEYNQDIIGQKGADLLRTITVVDASGLDENKVDVDRIPDDCPICNFHISPNQHYARLLSGKLYMLHQCPNSRCNESFLSVFKLVFDEGLMFYKYTSSYPRNYKSTSFKEEISILSEGFVRIYDQAAQAEDIGLIDICGPGYRKALEFLVKDYLIHLNPEMENEIKVKPLAQCIRDISDADIKFCAERATWLGNDETHYIKKWDTKDLEDLKVLITLTVNHITNNLLMEKYRREMAERR